MKITEAQFQRNVEELCDWRHLLHYHVQRSDLGRTKPGFPDLVIVGARVIYAELKTESGKQTPEQKKWEHGLRAAGAEFYLWRPSDMPEILKVLASLV